MAISTLKVSLSYKKMECLRDFQHSKGEMQTVTLSFLEKKHRENFPTISWWVDRHLQLVHSDICGPLPTLLRGCRYFLLFVDDFNRMTWVYFLKQKSEAFESSKFFVTLLKMK